MLNFRKIFIYIATTGRSVKSKGSISSMYHSNRSVIPVLCYSSCLITLLFSWPDVSFYRALMCLSSSILKWLEMPLWRAVSVGIYSVVSDWNQHHSRRISTNHQLQWRKGANNIFVKSPQYHVMYLRSGCFDGFGGPQGCAMQLRLVDQRTVHCSEPPMDPSLEGRERMDGWWYTRRRNTPLREKTIGKDDAPIKEDW